jgi:hypothetical protein
MEVATTLGSRSVINECNRDFSTTEQSLTVVPVDYSENHTDDQAECSDHHHDENIS